MSSINCINRDIYDLWCAQCKSRNEKLPLPGFLREPKLNTIAFMGMNPSLNKNGYKNLLNKSNTPWIKNLDFREFIFADYQVKRSFEEIDQLISKVHQVEDAIGDGGHPYVKALEPIIEHLGFNRRSCVFLDLFLFRGNKQDDFLRTFIFKSDNETDFTQLAEELIEITIKALAINKPKVIVLPNKGAADLLLRKIPSEFSNEYGTRVIYIGGKSIPIFLSSNLYLGYRLDEYSQERLKWHIKFVYDKVSDLL